MSPTVTTGVNDQGKATIFCHACRHVFARDLAPWQAMIRRRDIHHECKHREAAK